MLKCTGRKASPATFPVNRACTGASALPAIVIFDSIVMRPVYWLYGVILVLVDEENGSPRRSRQRTPLK